MEEVRAVTTEAPSETKFWLYMGDSQRMGAGGYRIENGMRLIQSPEHPGKICLKVQWSLHEVADVPNGPSDLWQPVVA